MCTIWIDHYGRFFDAWDRINLTVPQMQYILGYGNIPNHTSPFRW